MNRRRFIALIGAAVPGLWIDGTGLIQLPKRMVIDISGRCSFCGMDAGMAFGVAGVTGRSARVCNGCIDICLEILRDDLIYGSAPPPPPPPPPPDARHFFSASSANFDFEIIGATRDASAPQTEAELEALRAELEAFIEQARKLPDRPEPNRPRRDVKLICSFCDRKQHEAKKLIAGPQVFICDVCAFDAAALISMHS